MTHAGHMPCYERMADSAGLIDLGFTADDVFNMIGGAANMEPAILEAIGAIGSQPIDVRMDFYAIVLPVCLSSIDG